VLLGEITCPSGELVVMDGGYLGRWSADPHRDRVRRAVAGADPSFPVGGIPAVGVGGLPSRRTLPVIAAEGGEWGWTHLRVVVSDEPVATTRPAVRAAESEGATIDVGGARLMFAMTPGGDGFFPVHLEHDATGALIAVQVTFEDTD
jgi:hypothetical protein